MSDDDEELRDLLRYVIYNHIATQNAILRVVETRFSIEDVSKLFHEGQQMFAASLGEDINDAPLELGRYCVRCGSKDKKVLN